MYNFYTTAPKGGIIINKYGLKKLVESLGYAKYYLSNEKTTTPIYIYKSGRIIEPVIPLRVHEAVVRELESLAGTPGSIPIVDLPLVVDKLVDRRILTSQELLITMNELDRPIISDTKDSAIFPFKNGVVTVTKEDIKFSEPDLLNGYVWASDIIDWDFKPISFEEAQKSDFCKLIYNVTSIRTSLGWRRHEERFASLFNLLGYMLHTYKDPTNPRAVIFMDSSTEGKPMGRTCKGVVVFGLGRMRGSVTLDGKHFEGLDRFNFSKVTVNTKILFLDDVWKNFNFENFFSIVTEGIRIEEKYERSFYIPFNKSPKIIISTNYALYGQGSSHEARKYEFAFSNYYSSTFSPIDEFGRRLFDDWDAVQWNYFYNFMLYAVQSYLNDGVSVAADPAIDEKKLLIVTSPEFVKWAHDQEFTIGQRFETSEIYDRYIKQTEATTDRKAFIGYLRSYAQMNGWVLAMSHSGSVRYVEFRLE